MFCAAARILVHEARSTNAFNELAVVCAYLQPHTIELALKQLPEMFYAVADRADESACIHRRARENGAVS